MTKQIFLSKSKIQKNSWESVHKELYVDFLDFQAPQNHWLTHNMFLSADNALSAWRGRIPPKQLMAWCVSVVPSHPLFANQFSKAAWREKLVWKSHLRQFSFPFGGDLESTRSSLPSQIINSLSRQQVFGIFTTCFLRYYLSLFAEFPHRCGTVLTKKLFFNTLCFTRLESLKTRSRSWRTFPAFN